MTWWDSLEMLSRLQTALAILISVLGISTLTIKHRSDHLKKQADAKRNVERAKLDKELQEQTATALRATKELEERTRPKPFDERLRMFLDSADKRILPALADGKTQIILNGLEINKVAQLKMLCAEPESSKYINLKLLGGQKFMSDGTIATDIEITLNTNLMIKVENLSK